MRYLIALCSLAICMAITPAAEAQVYTTYYAPVRVVAARPVYAPTAYQAYYAPAYAPAYGATVANYPTTVYRPATPTYYAAPVGVPAVSYYSAYGGYEVRVPGQPIRNTIRTIVP